MTRNRKLIRLIAADILAHLQAVARDFSGWLGRAVSQYSAQIFDDGLTLTPLAESFGAPRSEMEGGLRSVLGAPPIEYAERVRLEVSARTLRRTELAVSEIAGTVGFGSRERLDEAFIRTFNRTPEAYRARRAERVVPALDPGRAVRTLAGEVLPRTIDRVSLGLVPGEEPFARPPEEAAPRDWIHGERWQRRRSCSARRRDRGWRSASPARTWNIRHRWSLDLAVHLQGLIELAADEVEQATDTRPAIATAAAQRLAGRSEEEPEMRLVGDEEKRAEALCEAMWAAVEVAHRMTPSWDDASVRAAERLFAELLLRRIP